MIVIKLRIFRDTGTHVNALHAPPSRLIAGLMREEPRYGNTIIASRRTVRDWPPISLGRRHGRYRINMATYQGRHASLWREVSYAAFR